jgi:hypothetical protein
MVGLSPVHGNHDPSHAKLHQRADLQSLQSDSVAGSSRELGARQANSPQGTCQGIHKPSNPIAGVDWPASCCRGTVGEQGQLAFPDAVFQVAARTREQSIVSYRRRTPALSRLNDVTTKRRLPSPLIPSA